MRLAFLTDVHIGGGVDGFQQQPRWPGGTEFLLDRLRGRLARDRVERVIIGGDCIEDAGCEQIERAVALLSRIPCPAIVCLGNHDLTRPQALDHWRQALRAWPQAAMADAFVELDSCDICALNTHWLDDGRAVMRWPLGTNPVPCLTDEQLQQAERFLARRTDRPAIVAFHAQMDPLPPDLTHLPEPIHASPPEYIGPLSRIFDGCNRPILVLAGHCHATCATRHGRWLHVSGSAFNEVPYQYLLVDVADGRITVSAQAIGPVDGGPRVDESKRWVLGRPEDRRLIF